MSSRQTGSDATPGHPVNIPHSDFFWDFLVAEQGLARHTLEAYERDLRHLAQFLAPLSLSEVTREQLRAYLHHLTEQGYAENSSARQLSAINRYFAFLVDEGLRGDNPLDALERPRTRRPLPNDLSEAQVTKLLESAKRRAQAGEPDAVRSWTLLEMLYASGLRISELVSLPVGSVQAQPDLIEVLGKGNKTRLVPLGRGAKDALQAYLPLRTHFLPAKSQAKARTFLFPSHGQQGHLTRQGAAKYLKALALEAGIAPSAVSPHVLRHAFASHLLNNGADLRVVQTLLGHASLSTTEIYTHILTSRLQALVEDKHPLGRIDPQDQPQD